MIATVESTTARLPPSERDFQVYRFVKVECHSTRAAAQVFDVSQTRVRQIIARVVDYLVESVPQSEDEDATDQRLYVAEHLAREQLEYLYQTAMEAWHASQRPDAFGVCSFGKVTYLGMAARISLWMAKVPVHPLPRIVEEEPPIDSPPVEDCSPGEVSRSAEDDADARSLPANGAEQTTYKTLDEIQDEARQMFLRPAQPPAPATSESPESGADPAASTHRPLNRHERRARQRRLAKALAKR